MGDVFQIAGLGTATQPRGRDRRYCHAMSAIWAMIATLIIDALWLRREVPRFQKMFLVLWMLSACLLLHGRMARARS